MHGVIPKVPRRVLPAIAINDVDRGISTNPCTPSGSLGQLQSLTQLKTDLETIINDRDVSVKAIDTAISSPPSPHDSEVVATIDSVTQQVWPGLPTIPTVSNYGTDSAYLRAHGIPSYGLMPYPLTEEDAMTMHGADERLSIRGLRVGTEYMYLLLLALAGGENMSAD